MAVIVLLVNHPY